MSTLRDRLESLHAAIPAKAPTRTDDILTRSQDALRNGGILDRIPRVGTPLPAFELPDSDGTPIHLHDRLRNGPLIVTFFRGGWCRDCRAELEALQSQYAAVREMEADVIAISPCTVAVNASTRQKLGITFPILSDAGNAYADELGLAYTFSVELRELYEHLGIDLEAHNDDDSWTLPIPARFVVDGLGTIRSVQADPDPTRRPEPAETVDLLRHLG